MSNESGGHPPAAAQEQFRAGIEDAVILPLVLVAVAAKHLFHAALSLLIRILDYAFPILLQVMRFPLFTLRIIGDGIVALAKGVVRFLPVGGTKRDAWRVRISEWWAWVRQKISYRAFEEFVHHVFEDGMAWVFRKCRTLTPGGALLVITGAVLWIPISFGAATGLHIVLVAKAASLPPWMQLLHPVATIVAKSKLLVLPVYPAAWPQAKKHASVQAMIAFCRWLATLHLVRKTAYRFRQIEYAWATAAAALERGASRVGLDHVSSRLLAGLGAAADWIGNAFRPAWARIVQGVSRLPVIRHILKRYAVHYDGVDERQDAVPASEKISGFFGRWSIKFSAEYYEAKERDEALKAQARPQAETAAP